MRYAKIRKMDISNGPGIRISVFMQGCEFKCDGCFNKETWSFDGGKIFDEDTINRILDLCSLEHIRGLSILGGEALHPKNIEGSTILCRRFKELYPKKDLWVWTGFMYEGIKNSDIFNYIDVLVDGQYKKNLYSPSLKYKGSSNQRVIDIKKTRKKGSIVLYKDEEF